MISWKHSFKRLNEEYDIAKKKKQALDNLYTSGRISQMTRDSFNSEIVAAIAEIEKQQKELLTKMETKVAELHSQIQTLEMLLTNYEIQHVVSEIDEDTYQHEITLLNTGLDTAKHELQKIREAASQLCPTPATPMPPATEPTAEIPTPVIEAASSVSEPEVASIPTVETVTASPAEDEPKPEPTVEEIPPLCSSQELIEAAPEPVPEQVLVEASPEPAVEPAVAETPVETAENVALPEAEPVVETPIENVETAETVVETPVEAVTESPVEIEPETLEETVVEESEENAEAIAEIPIEAIQETPQTVENIILPEKPEPAEVIIDAYPTEAPKEAHPEIIAEPAAEQAENAEEAQTAAVEASSEENSEGENS